MQGISLSHYLTFTPPCHTSKSPWADCNSLALWLRAWKPTPLILPQIILIPPVLNLCVIILFIISFYWGSTSTQQQNNFDLQSCLPQVGISQDSSLGLMLSMVEMTLFLLWPRLTAVAELQPSVRKLTFSFFNLLFLIFQFISLILTL